MTFILSWHLLFQADKIARQKHLHSLDLFLESARTQLKTLIGEQVNKDPEEH